MAAASASAGAAATTGFLAERLAKATAVPAEQRSTDVRAFIETCRLQAELVEELGLPEAIDGNVLGELWSRWSAAPALKLARSHFVGSGAPLFHSPQLLAFAANMLYGRTSFGPTGTLPSDLGRELTELLEGDPSLESFAILAAVLPASDSKRGWGRGIYPKVNIGRPTCTVLQAPPTIHCSEGATRPP